MGRLCILAIGVATVSVLLPYLPFSAPLGLVGDSPWTRKAAVPHMEDLPSDARECLLSGSKRADEVVDAALAEAVYSEHFFGLSLVQEAISEKVVLQARREAFQLHKQGILTASGDPSEPPLSSQYKQYLGNLPVLTILTAQKVAEQGLQALAFVSAFLSRLCVRLSSFRPKHFDDLEPGTLQLALYDGEEYPVSYHVHEDYVAKGDYDPEDLPQHHRFSYKRRITAILYLQGDDWDEDKGGAFRAHKSRPREDSLDPNNFVDVQPEGGSLILFRSDMPHEVQATHGQRFALSMWCHAVGA
eukprot:TRINITY_DN79359_c0_g1_i1.p1 TRINITY_DN79359_c0_g1~~TRINITY_DN79359_c0_g1_i1.p1  ORF type:complete len:319 (+),score=56.05 TRINITY_DN79359_c0_g1_i1:56-958(+)